MENTTMENSDETITEAISKATDHNVGDPQERLRKLLRDIYYAGPLPKGKKPYRGVEQGDGSPGSNLRRSKEGALWGLSETKEDTIIEAAKEAGLIKETEEDNYFYTTQLGAAVLKELDTCEECGKVNKPHHQEKEVEISRWNTATNHSLLTKCLICFDRTPSWSRDEFPRTRARLDDAERLVRSRKDAAFYNAGNDEWIEPEVRALHDFIETINDTLTGIDRFRTRYSTPKTLPGAKNAFREVTDNYETDVIDKFADLLLDTYYGACLTDLEQAAVKHMAAGFPEADNHNKTHQTEYGNPIAISPDTEWEATIYTHEANEYHTITGKSEKAKSEFSFETESPGFQIRFKSYKYQRVSFLPSPNRGMANFATLVSFSTKDDTEYDNRNRVEIAVDLIESAIDNKSMREKLAIKKIFEKLANNKQIKKPGLIGSHYISLDMNMTELIRTARIIKHTTDENHLPDIIHVYAEKAIEEKS